MEKLVMLAVSGIFLILITIILVAIRNNAIQTYKDDHTNSDRLPLEYIPKKIFQLIADKKDINPQLQKNIKYIREKNPDWEYTLMDDTDMEEYLRNNYEPEILDLYLRINPKYGAARADFFRYLLMYREGGVYLDIKSAATIPLSEMLLPDDEYIICHWPHPTNSIELGDLKGEYQQWHIICRPYHPFLYHVIQKVVQNILSYEPKVLGIGRKGVLRTTGPIVYTNAIKPIRKMYRHRFVEFPDYIGLKYNNLGYGGSLFMFIKGHSHRTVYSKPHYSKINESIILSNSKK